MWGRDEIGLTLKSLEEQARQLTDEAALHHDLRLLIGRLEEFARQVTQQLDAADWDAYRELVRTLVARVEIDQTRVRVVFRVPPDPFVPSPEQGCLPDRWGREAADLENPSWRAGAHVRQRGVWRMRVVPRTSCTGYHQLSSLSRRMAVLGTDLSSKPSACQASCTRLLWSL